MQGVRIYEMPDCRMVSSGVGMFGEEKFEAFERWMSAQRRSMFPKDFLFWAGTGFQWVYMLEDGMDVPPEFDVINFKGGLHAVVTGIDQQTDKALLNAEVDRFLDEYGFERDPARAELGNIITSALAREIMGFEQMDYYMPIKGKKK